MKHISLGFKDKMVSSVASVAGSKIVQLSLEAGQGLTRHHTPLHLNLMVLEGEISFRIDEEERVLGPLEMIMVDPTVEHELTATKKSIVLLILLPTEAQKIQKRAEDFRPEHQNAYQHPELLNNITEEIKPLVEDHIELCEKLATVNPGINAETEDLLQDISYELEHHFTAEEEVLFPLFANYVGGSDVGPIPQMLEDHRVIRELNREAHQLLGVAKAEQDEHVQVLFIEKLIQLSHTLINHLGKEDSHLFPMASRLLSEDDKATLKIKLPEYQ